MDLAHRVGQARGDPIALGPEPQEEVMSASSAPDTTRRAEGPSDYYDEQGSGWVLFAGMMLAILGTMNIIYGIAAIDSANVFVADARYIFSDLNTWGWFLLGVGIVQFLAAISIWNRTEWGRWVGIFSAAVNAILQLLFLPAFPFLSLALFTLGILVIYGLIAYGGRPAAA
jgi:hypothetical protein